LVLPEISVEEANRIAHQMEETVKERMKIKLQIGTANFPAEAMTFESLIEVALKHAAEQPVQVHSIPKQVANPNLRDVRL
jgi:hypothetical protein